MIAVFDIEPGLVATSVHNNLRVAVEWESVISHLYRQYGNTHHEISH